MPLSRHNTRTRARERQHFSKSQNHRQFQLCHFLFKLEMWWSSFSFLSPSECSAVTRFTQSISDDWWSPVSGLSRGSEKFSRWKMSRSRLTGLASPDSPHLDWAEEGDDGSAQPAATVQKGRCRATLGTFSLFYQVWILLPNYNYRIY